MNRKYDIVIFGASGYTGLYVVEEAVNCLNPGNNIPHFTWAVAGRSVKKLQQTLHEVSKLTGVDVRNGDKIVANTEDMESLRQMAAQCSVVANVVGPYCFHGDAVVQACLAEGTHYVDISGELQFVEKMQVLYNEEAKVKGVYIVSTCGIGCIPLDCGVAYLEKHFEGKIGSIEAYAAIGLKDELKGIGISSGAWNSLVNYLGSLGQLKELRRKLLCRTLPKSKYCVTQQHWPLHYNNESKSWCTPFIGVDASVVERSQYLFYAQHEKRPVQFKAYSEFPYLLVCLGLAFAALLYFALSQFQFGRDVLVKYSQIFTFGLVKSGGPTREQAANSTFRFAMIAHGWNENLAQCTDQKTTPPNKIVRLIIRGDGPATSATANMLLQSAVTIMQERDKLPSSGGVYPPGFVFHKSTLVSRLQSRGIEFRIINDL